MADKATQEAVVESDGPLSIDEAAALIIPHDDGEKPEQDDGVGAAEETSDTPVEQDEPEAQTEGSDGEHEDADAEADAETEDDAAEGEEPELPPIDPPQFWNAEAKARFGELPRDLQELLAAKETEANRAVSKKFEEAANKAKAAEAEASKYANTLARLDQLIPEAEAAFAAQWGNGEIDWNKVAQEHGVETAFQLKNNHDMQQQQVQQLKAAKAKTDADQIAQFKQARATEIKTVVPELADAKNGPARQAELVNYLASQGGVDPQVVIDHASAKELAIAWKAYLYDKQTAEAKAKAASPSAQSAQKTAQVAQRHTVKPVAAQARTASTKQQRIDRLSKQAALTLDEAVELQILQGT